MSSVKKVFNYIGLVALEEGGKMKEAEQLAFFLALLPLFSNSNSHLLHEQGGVKTFAYPFFKFIIEK